ncbi:MAG: C/D box methylation guide ribonucleoprotein complex aNOP56 subunit [Acidilobaceae archaeon]
MRVYIVALPIGFLALDENGGVADYEFYPRAIDEAVEELLKLETGGVNFALSSLLERLRGKAGEVVLEDDTLARNVASLGFATSTALDAEVQKRARSRLAEIAVSLGFAKSREELDRWIHEVSVEYSRRKLRKAAAKRDLLAVQAIRAIDDIDKIVNLLATRTREWYSVHFPELSEQVEDHEMFLKLVYELGHRENFTVESLTKLGLSESKARKLAEAASASVGADVSELDVEAVRVLAGIVLDLYEHRRTLTKYVSEVMEETAPNVTALVGPLLGARLLSLAGGLEKLARLPASTIQVLGAEKALFRALRTGGKPPKHGVIFQYPDIHRSPKWQRGKIARALAAKLAIAARIDAFTGRLLGEKLVKELRERIEEIKKLYPKPPAKKEEVKPKVPPRREKKQARRREEKR